MEFTTIAVADLAGLAAYLSGAGTYAASTGDAPTNIQIEEAEISESIVTISEGVDARGRAQLSLISWELNHFKLVTSILGFS
eukprot:CFRG2184T1